MNSKDIKPWRERLAIIPVVPTVSRSVARFKCIFDEISELRQALVAAEARERDRQNHGRHADIIKEAISSYQSWLIDDDYDAHSMLRSIIERMQERMKP